MHDPQVRIYSDNNIMMASTGVTFASSSRDDSDDSGEDDDNSGVETLHNHTISTVNPAATTAGAKIYPMDFFTKLGTVHTDRDELIQRWVYRKDCPTEISGSVSESTPFLHDVLVQEMVAMRESLSKYAYSVYLQAATETANYLGLTTPICHQSIIRSNDLKAAISVLTRTAENELLVYKVFHHRMRTDKAWQSAIVDSWASLQNIQLMPTNGIYQKRCRPLATNRQGFGNICLEERKKMLQMYMRVMTKKCGWSIATTDKSKQATKNPQIYTKRVMVDEDSDQRKEYLFYVVEPLNAVSGEAILSHYVKTTRSFLTTFASSVLSTGVNIHRRKLFFVK